MKYIPHPSFEQKKSVNLILQRFRETEEWALIQITDKINMVHPRKIWLAESWGIFKTLDLKLS